MKTYIKLNIITGKNIPPAVKLTDRDVKQLNYAFGVNGSGVRYVLYKGAVWLQPTKSAWFGHTASSRQEATQNRTASIAVVSILSGGSGCHESTRNDRTRKTRESSESSGCALRQGWTSGVTSLAVYGLLSVWRMERHDPHITSWIRLCSWILVDWARSRRFFSSLVSWLLW